MKISKSVFCLALVVLMSFAATTRSFADTYQIIPFLSDQEYFFYGMDAAGDVVMDVTAKGLCGPKAAFCYETFVGGLTASLSTTVPALTYDDGASCTPTLSAGQSFNYAACNNGRVAFTGFLTPAQQTTGRSGAYTGPNSNPSASTLANEVDSGTQPLYINSTGDVVFDNVFAEEWYEAFDLTTAATPEPSSLILLGTGALAAIAAARRRLSR